MLANTITYNLYNLECNNFKPSKTDRRQTSSVTRRLRNIKNPISPGKKNTNSSNPKPKQCLASRINRNIIGGRRA